MLARNLVLMSSPFRMADNWRQNAAGLWLAPDDLATQWQESTRSTPGAVNSPVGYVDKKAGNIAGLLQATAAARPTLSQRVNMLLATALLSGAGWTKRGTAAISADTAPDGTGETLTGLGAKGTNDFYQPPTANIATGTRCEPQVSIWPISVVGTVHLANAENVVNGDWTIDLALLTAGQWNTLTRSHAAVTVAAEFSGVNSRAQHQYWCSSGAPVTFYIKNPQVEVGTVSTRYQSVNTATDYDTAGFPYFWRFDGTDDGLASAAFDAGTLTSNMDCFIAAKRNSAADGTVCSFDSGTGFFGYYASGSASAATGAAAGTPTYFVDGVQVTGGAAVTAGNLHTALTVGAWHILEVRNLDLSTWTAFRLSLYTALMVNGNVGGAVACVAQTDARRAKIRRYLANQVQLAL